MRTCHYFVSLIKEKQRFYPWTKPKKVYVRSISHIRSNVIKYVCLGNWFTAWWLGRALAKNVILYPLSITEEKRGIQMKRNKESSRMPELFLLTWCKVYFMVWQPRKNKDVFRNGINHTIFFLRTNKAGHCCIWFINNSEWFCGLFCLVVFFNSPEREKHVSEKGCWRKLLDRCVYVQLGGRGGCCFPPQRAENGRLWRCPGYLRCGSEGARVTLTASH